MGLRQERLADEIRDVLASCFQGGQLSDPRLQWVTITATKLSPDLQVASVYFRVYPGASEVEAEAGLKSAVSYLRKRLGQTLEIRRVPSLRFFYDESIERGAKVEGILRDLE